MSQQSVYRDMDAAFPGLRHGITGHRSRSMVNDTGSVRQVADITVSAAADATYQFEVDVGGGALAITVAGLAADGVGGIRDKLLAQARQIGAFEGRVAFNAQGAAGVRMTAVRAGQGFTATETDTNLALAQTVANVTPIDIPFGRALVHRAGAGTSERSAGLATATGATFAGVLERTHSSVNPTLANPADRIAKASPGQDLSVLYQGAIWVEVEEAVNEGDSVFFRHTASGVNTEIGRFRTDADTATADQITGAKFASRTTGPGLAILELT